MSLYELITSDSGATLVAAVFTFATAIITFISAMWASNRKKNGTQQMHPRSYVQSLQSERSKLIADLTKAIEDRERLSAQVATLTAKLESREHDLAVIKLQVESLIKAIKRLDPNLLAAFGSDFVPL